VSEAQARTESQSRTQSPARRLSLNTDGQRHTLINAAAVYAVAAGAVSLTIGMINTAHVAGSVLGVTGFLVGMVAQMMSVTRPERIVIVLGIVLSFVGMGLALAHGGFG